MNSDSEHLMWDLIVEFFKAKRSFENQREKYEEMVNDYARKQSVDRRKLHLGTREVGALLDFKAIEELRNHYLRNLKNLSHDMFRTDDTTESFDKYVSDIYHEVSILKEEHYTVLTYAPAYEEGAQPDLTERDKILDEVHEFFPKKVSQIHSLFQKAQARLEEILPRYGQNKIFIRSIYLFGDEFLKKVTEEGLVKLYEKIYPAGGAVEGYVAVARSFHESSFYSEAEGALKKARNALKKSKLPDDEKKKRREEIKQLEKLTSTALAH